MNAECEAESDATDVQESPERKLKRNIEEAGLSD
jgi:hypothetical protein